MYGAVVACKITWRMYILVHAYKHNDVCIYIYTHVCDVCNSTYVCLACELSAVASPTSLARNRQMATEQRICSPLEHTKLSWYPKS